MDTMASQITSLTIVYSSVYSGADQRKHQSSASLAFARGIHRWPVNSPHKWPVSRKMFPFDDVIMVNDAFPISMACFRDFIHWNSCKVPYDTNAKTTDWTEYQVSYRLHPLSSWCITWFSTHWGRDKMAGIFQTSFSNVFSWIGIYDFD